MEFLLYQIVMRINKNEIRDFQDFYSEWKEIIILFLSPSKKETITHHLSLLASFQEIPNSHGM